MKTRRWGATAWHVPVIGQGTWHLEQTPRRRAIETLRRGIDLGLTHVDTAEMYGDGAAEELVGEALEGRRDEVFLVSKVVPGNASYEGTIAACERSLRRLATDRLDCYLLHWRGAYPLEETFNAFEQLVEDGKIRSWGVSNFDVDDLEEASELVDLERITCNQVLYHLQERTAEYRVLPWCAAHGVSMVGYSPFGSGRFPSLSSHGGRVLAEIAQAHDATPRQVALAFLARDPHAFVIPKASSVEHVEENAGAAELELDRREVAWIDEAFAHAPSAELPML